MKPLNASLQVSQKALPSWPLLLTHKYHRVLFKCYSLLLGTTIQCYSKLDRIQNSATSVFPINIIKKEQTQTLNDCNLYNAGLFSVSKRLYTITQNRLSFCCCSPVTQNKNKQLNVERTPPPH